MSVKTELKLAYLKDTKNLIKNAIIEKGQEVSDSDTFRSYAEKILGIESGGSGEGATIDLNGLPVIFPDTELTALAEFDGVAPVMEPFDLVAGDLCLVNWNGTGYLCKAKPVNFNGLPIVGIGNTIALGGENTGEPFAVGCIPAELTVHTNGAYGLVAPLDGTTTFKLGIYKLKNILENLPIALDFSEGNQTIVAPDGYLVESAIIQKPDNLKPENIMSGIDIAGVIGTAVAGGGSGGGSKKIKVVYTSLSVSSSLTRASKQICTKDENDPFFVLVFRPSPKPFSQTTMTDRRFTYAYAFDTKNFVFSKAGLSSNFYARQVAYREGAYGITFTSNTETGLLDPIDTTGLTGDKLLMHPGDIYFYRDSTGAGYIDVGLPFSSKDGNTYKWYESDAHTVIALIMEDE